ncbi:DNA-binding transcriptional regulator, LacI/PurR family [Amycolatopsis arida]|uniref:DNA-binding transcriptional regulator, LacI/PurR family n=1 Tax=Amycolatopsis arida TaxID=587909 RepID=A0A1I5THK0_9PSEU|nr:LacI family DNA-binding transcriptional regulator [Amycolatopsis arida]TDX96090.1 DNA-binding LacI/PurR family transcriptional regulator [Amycolatopsis arida]SFP82530.1 DNA-binding transcriptional regulator, LacI/PurR family [Amycolatopsis arida]
MTQQHAEQAVRLADIAERAGVSEATVSRVLNGKAGVAAATRQAVLTAMDLLGYERPARARQRSAGLIGLIIPELDNPIFPAFAQVIERTLAMHGYTSVLCTHTPGGASEDEFVEALTGRGVAGIVFVSGAHSDTTASHDRYVRLVERGMPMVFLNGYAPGVRAPFFSTDDGAAVELAIGHLRELGHERIGLAVGPDRFVPAQRKAAAFRRLMEPVVGAEEADRLVVHSLFSVEGGHSAGWALLERGCTAVVCGSDLMALGAIRVARRRGLAVPRDFSVVGFDDSLLIAFTDPPLTTIRQPVPAMATAAVRTLLEETRGVAPPSGEYLFAPELLVRGSTAARPPARG